MDEGICSMFPRNGILERISTLPLIHITNFGLDRLVKGYWPQNKICYGGERGIPIPQPTKLDNLNIADQRTWPRHYLVTFHGTFISGSNNYHYSYGVRPSLKKEMDNVLMNQTYANTFEIELDLGTSFPNTINYFKTKSIHTFQLCPAGWEPWSPRLYDGMYKGTIPIIIADGMKLPFSTYIDWNSFSLKWLMNTAKSQLVLVNLFKLKKEQPKIVKQLHDHVIENFPYLDWRRSWKNVLERKSPLYMLFRELGCLNKRRRTILSSNSKTCSHQDILLSLSSNEIVPPCLCQSVIKSKGILPAKNITTKDKKLFQEFVLEDLRHSKVQVQVLEVHVKQNWLQYILNMF